MKITDPDYAAIRARHRLTTAYNTRRLHAALSDVRSDDDMGARTEQSACRQTTAQDLFRCE